MNELALKYGCNPNQKPSRIYMEDGSDLPVTVLNGKPGYINFLDALNSIQLVKELKTACGLPAAASFKHVSPAGAALGLPLTEVERRMYHIAPETELSPLACAYARARGADRMSSFGDWIALSDICDVPTAKLIQHEVSDGIIAPGYEPEALAILSGKKKGNYNVVAIDPAYKPAPIEHKQVYGITFEQGRNELVINADTMLKLPDFRASERTYDLLEQVAGRAGRGGRPGEVVVQTYWATHPAMQAVLLHDRSVFLTAELEEREDAGYPPFSRLGNVTLWGRDERAVRQAADGMAAALREQVDSLVVIPNERLKFVSEQKITFKNAFIIADDVLRQGVQSISELINVTALVNLDFADVKSIMADAGYAHMGVGVATGRGPFGRCPRRYASCGRG